MGHFMHQTNTLVSEVSMLNNSKAVITMEEAATASLCQDYERVSCKCQEPFQAKQSQQLLGSRFGTQVHKAFR